MFPDITRTVRAWLSADAGVAAISGVRVLTSQAADGPGPQIVIYDGSGAPDRTAQGFHPHSDCTVTLWCVAGRRNGGRDDLPDRATANALSSAVVAAADRVNRHRFVDASTGASIEAGSVFAVVPARPDPDLSKARSTVTLQLRIAG